MLNFMFGVLCIREPGCAQRGTQSEVSPISDTLNWLDDDSMTA